MPGTFDTLPHKEHPEHDLRMGQANSWERDAFDLLQDDPEKLEAFTFALEAYGQMKRIGLESTYFKTRRISQRSDGGLVDTLPYQVEAILMMSEVRLS